MKLHILSDLHLEFAAFVPPETDADVVVLAGDISNGTNGIVWARAMFPDKEILYVPGNHEFYGEERRATLKAMREAAHEQGIHLLDEDEVVIPRPNGAGNVRFLGCTLWTDFQLFGRNLKAEAMEIGQERLADFRLIREGDGLFTPARSVELHEWALSWLQAKLDAPFDGKTVVITHHLPSEHSVVERFKTSLLSACFASELGYLYGKMGLWVHGHTHDNLEYVENGTRVICNPRGYVTRRGQENSAFNPSLALEV